MKLALGEGPQPLRSTIGARELSFDWFNDGDSETEPGQAIDKAADLLQASVLSGSGEVLVAQGQGPVVIAQGAVTWVKQLQRLPK